VLALSGKINNSLNTKLDRLLSAQAVRNIIISLGVDPGSLDVNAENPTFKVDKLRCQRVYLLADADPDGAHINVLLLSFFFRLMPDFIREGRLWVVDGSLYSATWKGKVYSGDTREEVAEMMGTKNAVVLSRILRVKGWGEVEPIVLDQDAFNPVTRRVRQIEWTDNPNDIQYFRHIAAESPAHKRELLGLKEA
jgi:DNA gyrase/topoisomerase IV subunit B